MHFERLRTNVNNMYPRALDLYKLSFPYHEQRNAVSQAGIMSHEEYHFELIYDEHEWIGLLLFWETEMFIYVEHFCIRQEKRNRKYGQRALDLLNDSGKKVILEIDPPIDEDSIRRKGFYEKAGYGGHRLVLMSRPDLLTSEEYDDFNRYLGETVMDNIEE